MNCVEWEARVALHAGGDLAGANAMGVERHLGECSACQLLWSRSAGKSGGICRRHTPKYQRRRTSPPCAGV